MYNLFYMLNYYLRVNEQIVKQMNTRAAVINTKLIMSKAFDSLSRINICLFYNKKISDI